MQTPESIAMQERMADFKKLCREHSLRVTNQRVEIFRMLASFKEHPSVEQVFEFVRKKLPNISLDTVYRTISSMEDAGVVFRVGLSNRARFDADLNPHYHFVCMECGAVYDIFPSEGKNLLEVPAQVKNFGEVKNVNLQFHGICKHCCKAANDVKN